MKITREQSFQFRPRARIEGVLRLKPAAPMPYRIASSPMVASVCAPTLLIVRGADCEVIALNTQALELLNCGKRLEITQARPTFLRSPRDQVVDFGGPAV